jgi:hypothetical protein
MISSGYTPQGGNSLTTQGLSFATPPGSAAGLPFDPTAAIREKLRREAEQTAFENSLRERQMRLMERQAREQQRLAAQERAQSMNREMPRREDPLAALKAQDQYEATLRGAATRPTGLGPQMLPGMAVDPNLLPSRLRPQGSSFQGTAGPSMAGLSPSAPPPPPTSHRGYDFADPYSQAMLQRSAFGGR